MTNAKLLDKLREMHGLDSDSALADYYKVDRRVVSNFRQREGTRNIQRLIIDDLLKQLTKTKGSKS